MNHGFATLLVVCVFVSVSSGCHTSPKIEYYATGKTATLEELEGRVVVVNIWAEWCRPCIEEMPELIRLTDTYDGEVVFIALHHQGSMNDRRKLKPWLDAQPRYFVERVTFGTRSMRRRFPGNSIPVTYVVDRQGQKAAKFVGQIKGERLHELRARIDEALGG